MLSPHLEHPTATPNYLRPFYAREGNQQAGGGVPRGRAAHSALGIDTHIFLIKIDNFDPNYA